MLSSSVTLEQCSVSQGGMSILWIQGGPVQLFLYSTIYKLVQTSLIILSLGSGQQKIKVALWGDVAYRFNGDTLKFLGQTESAVVVFVGTTVREYSGIH